MKNNPPADVDALTVAKLATLGIVPPPIRHQSNGADVAKAIADGVEDAKKEIAELGHNPGNTREANSWMMMVRDIGAYRTNYPVRAAIAWVGRGANVLEDAFYPLARVDGDGNLLNSATKYVIHFDKGQTPPANAFWSLTAYNAKQCFIANPINRYAIGDRDEMKFNPDGSL